MSISGCPEHIGIIMDGNGRWAKMRGLPRTAGHKKGAEAMENLISFVEKETDIKFLTFYAFSTENWSRPKEEVDYLMRLFESHLDRLLATTENHNVILKFTGDRSLLSPNLVSKMNECEEKTKKNSKLCVFIALNYGGRQEIATACKSIAKKCASGLLNADEITEQAISEELKLSSPPDADLIIRPSGELRLSNFLLWQCAYSELYFSDVLWPDFNDKSLIDAINSFSKRNRRFGGV